MASADCPDPVAALRQAESRISSGALEEAAVALAGAEAGFGCGAVVTTALLGRLWRAEGMPLLARDQGGPACQRGAVVLLPSPR